MYPIITRAELKGSGKSPFIQALDDGKEYELTEDQVRILGHTNGSNTVANIAMATGLPESDITGLYDQMGDYIQMSDTQNRQPLIVLPQDPYCHELHFDLINACNLKCPHCYIMPSLPESRLSYSEVVEVLADARKLRVARVNISGGECFLHPDLLEIVAACYNKGLFLATLFTNGTVERPEVLDVLKGTTIAVSLDGMEERHNAPIRGKDNFYKTVAFIEDCLKRGLRVVVDTMVTGANYKHLPRFGDFLHKMGVKHWRLALPRQQGLQKGKKGLVLKDVFRHYMKLIRWSLGKEINVQIESFFKSAILKAKEYYTFTEDSSCCAYKENAICVKPDGLVTACTALYAKPLGNVRERSLYDIWYSDETQTVKKIPVRDTQCRGCEFLQYCGGGCRQIAHELHGDWTAKDDDACELYKLFAGNIIPLYEKMGIKPVSL